MSIEFIFNTVTVQHDQIQEQFPHLVSMVNSYLPAKETHKRRRRKKKLTAGPLIQEIIDSIDSTEE